MHNTHGKKRKLIDNMSSPSKDIHDEVVQREFASNVSDVEIVDIFGNLVCIGGDEGEEGVVVTLANSHQTRLFHETTKFWRGKKLIKDEKKALANSH